MTISRFSLNYTFLSIVMASTLLKDTLVHICTIVSLCVVGLGGAFSDEGSVTWLG